MITEHALLDVTPGRERLEDHTEGFRNSGAYQDWKRLLHHFYDPCPIVEHFTVVATV